MKRFGFVLTLALVASCGSDSGNPLPALTSMQLTPGTFIVAVSKNRRIISELVAQNGQRFDVSSSATWTSADPMIATATSGGNIVGVGAGTTTVSASRDGLTGSAMVMVTAHEVMSIAVTPGNVAIPVGGTATFKAVATESDGSMVDVTDAATWLSNNLAAVTVTKGTVTGVSAGQATVTASSQAIASNGVKVVVGGSAIDASVDGPEADAAETDGP